MDIDIKSPFWSPAGASGFILDWDGVIAETRLDFTPLREKYYGGRRAMLLEEACTLAPATREEFFAELVALEMAGAEKAEPVEGARELLAWLNENGVPYCVVSRNCMEVIKRGAEVIGVELPEKTWGRDNSTWVKPDPRALYAAAEAIGAEPRRCVYVGDFLYDLQGARRAGMRAVLVQRENPEWGAWADVMYPKMTELVADIRLMPVIISTPIQKLPLTTHVPKTSLEKMQKNLVFALDRIFKEHYPATHMEFLLHPSSEMQK